MILVDLTPHARAEIAAKRAHEEHHREAGVREVHEGEKAGLCALKRSSMKTFRGSPPRGEGSSISSGPAARRGVETWPGRFRDREEDHEDEVEEMRRRATTTPFPEVAPQPCRQG